MPTVANICTFLGDFAPLSLAASWDNVGLLFGDTSTSVQKVMTCLTVTPESAAEAIENEAQLIVSHHPILFQGSKHITTQTPEGKTLWELARANVAVYSPHTAFDSTRGGINDILADLLGLQNVAPLRVRQSEPECKIVVFVPKTDLEPVSNALFAAGAGQIGDYRECSYRLAGTGTFFGTENTNPTVGQKGQRELADEIRLEVVCPERLLNQAIAAIRQAHSYEEPAFDVYPLMARPSAIGEGRIGQLPQSVTFQELVQTTKGVLNAAFVQAVGDLNRTVQSVALACGAAGEFLTDAHNKKADVFLTGEMRFHDLLKAQSWELSLLLPGHFATERIGVERLANTLSQQWPDLTVWASRQEKEPLRTFV